MRFREKAPSTSAPPLPEVRRDLLGIFARMDNQAKRDPLLMEPYHQVHYALVALADEVVLTSGWEHSPAWRQALLEERFYNTQQAGSHFFELANKLENAPQDVVAIFYLCLALGFSGRYAPADHELAEVKERLLARLPSKPRIMEEPAKARAQKDRRLRSWLWTTAGAALLMGMVILGWDQWQTTQSPRPEVASSPAAKPAPPAPKAPAQAKPDQVQQAAAPAKSADATEDKAEAAKAPQPVSRPAPTPASQAKVEPAAKEKAPEPTGPEPEAASQAEDRKEIQEPPTQAPQPPPAAQASAPATKETAPPTAQLEKPVAAAASQAAPKEKGYRVRVGVYVGPIQSGRFTDKLKEAGFPATLEKLERPEGKVLYVVSITPLPSLAEAERVQAEIKLKFGVNGVIKEN